MTEEEIRKEYGIAMKALLLIERIAGEEETLPEWPDHNPQWGTVYRYAHTATSVDCRKNHPKWLTQLEEDFERGAK